MRKIIISLLLVGVMIVPAFAQPMPVVTSARAASMNLGADDLEDIGNIVSYPQLLPLYTNRVWYNDLDGYMEQTVLIHDLGAYTIAAGIFVNSGAMVGICNPSVIGAGYLMMGPEDAPNVDSIYPNSILNLGFAGELAGGQFGALLLVNMASSVNEPSDTNFVATPDNVDTGPTRDDGASYFGVIVGYGMEEVGPFARLDTSLGIGLPGFSTEWVDELTTAQKAANPLKAPDTQTWEKDAGMDLEIQAQGIMELDDANSLRLGIGYARSSISDISTASVDGDNDGSFTTATGGDTNNIAENTQTISEISLTAALNKQVNDGGLLVVATGLVIAGDEDVDTESQWADTDGNGVYTQEVEYDDTQTNSMMYIPLAIAVEDEIRENITLRIGAKKYVLVKQSSEQDDNDMGMVDGAYGTTDTSADENSYLWSEDVYTSLGVGAVLGNFTVNAVIETDMLFNGPYWITGDDSNFATMIDVIYPF